jgi:hypothetical protein
MADQDPGCVIRCYPILDQPVLECYDHIHVSCLFEQSPLPADNQACDHQRDGIQ